MALIQSQGRIWFNQKPRKFLTEYEFLVVLLYMCLRMFYHLLDLHGCTDARTVESVQNPPL
jgi:hypothetical protein